MRHATLPVAVRLDDGAEVASLDLAAAYPVAVAPLGEAERAAAARTLQAAFRRAAPEVLGMALEAIARRARRDLLRMADYYASLDGEMARAVDRTRSPEERTRREAKRRLLPQELEARRAQLRDRLAARLGAELVAATVVETEVDACDIPVRRRTAPPRSSSGAALATACSRGRRAPAARGARCTCTSATTGCIRSARAAAGPDASMPPAVRPAGRAARAPLSRFPSKTRPRGCGWGGEASAGAAAVSRAARCGRRLPGPVRAREDRRR